MMHVVLRLALGCGSVFFALAAGGCGSTRQSEASLSELKGGIEIGLRRGAAWSTFTVKPPYVIGQAGSLRFHKGNMLGTLGGRQVNFRVEPDNLSGQLSSAQRADGLPMQTGGTIEVDIDGGPESLEISGVWNGRRVRFTVTPQTLNGTISALSGYGGGGQCQYVLDQADQDGTRRGVSTCFGLPEETIVEIPEPLGGWLTRSEMVSVLLALLSTPPVAGAETRSLIGF
jgi:hypothetical protein